jgi:redox-sensitive bicupin YhaK (pirin superfamily)
MSTRVDDELQNQRGTVASPVELTIEPRVRSLGDFDVRRVLPAAKRRMVGPFVFLDHMGPAVFPPNRGIAVRPHPHIGLATITYLFEGEIMHRDSLGFTQLIQPGAVNLMTAGRGIVHSERAGDDLSVESRLHGVQSWIALPVELEEMEPTFLHYPVSSLPQRSIEGCGVRVIMGSAYGLHSPVQTYSPMLYFEATLPRGGALAVVDAAPERAIYVVSGRVVIGDGAYGEGALAVLRTGSTVSLRAETETRVIVIGGAPLGPRHIWWNFVSSSEARIERAKQDWREMRMGRVPGDDELIPLPNN